MNESSIPKQHVDAHDAHMRMVVTEELRGRGRLGRTLIEAEEFAVRRRAWEDAAASASKRIAASVCYNVVLAARRREKKKKAPVKAPVKASVSESRGRAIDMQALEEALSDPR